MYLFIEFQKNIRREYVCLLRNDSLKLESESTRVCSAHWTEGKKLSKNQLLSVFPWTKKRNERQILSKTQFVEKSIGKKKEFEESSAEIESLIYQFNWSSIHTDSHSIIF